MTASTLQPSSQPTSRWSNLKRIGKRLVLGTSLPEIMLIASLSIARYLQNSDFSYPSEIVIDIVLLAVYITVVYYVLRLVLRSRLAAHIASLFLAYNSYAFSYSFPTLHRWLDGPIPDSWTSYERSLALLLEYLIVFGLLGWSVNKFVQSRRSLRNLPLLQFAVFVIAFIFVSQLGKMGLRMWDIRKDLAYKQPAVTIQQPKTTSTNSDKPDVYYLLFDRYANDTTLKNIYNYDNTPLLNFLNTEGFVTRKDSYANYPFTMMSVSSTLAMNYQTKIGAEFKDDAGSFQAAFPYRTILDNPPVVQELKKQGYSYNQISSWWDFTRGIPAANSEPTRSFELRMFGKSFWLTDLQRDIFGKSVLFPLLDKGLHIDNLTVAAYQNDRNPTQNFETQVAAVKKIASSSKSTAAPQFTFAHFLSPHDPYIFDNTGATPKYNQDRTDEGADETVKYTNQVTYLNTQIQSIIASIRQDDPKAVIVLQADEGPYPKEFRGTLTPTHYYDPINLQLPQMRQKFGVLASYYLPGVSQGATTSPINANVNAFRFVLNQYLGYQLPLLPDCQFTTGDKYKLYNYQQVTGKLDGTTNPAQCAAYK
jgi:hypothetical protein